MIDNTTKSIKKICFLSADYRLLKFIGLPNIHYTLGSQAYYDDVTVPAERQQSLTEYQLVLKKNKASKLFVYSSLTELVQFFVTTFGVTQKI